MQKALPPALRLAAVRLAARPRRSGSGLHQLHRHGLQQHPGGPFLYGQLQGRRDLPLRGRGG